MSLLQDNKAAVVRFNKEVIERGDLVAFRSLMAEGFVNYSARPGTDNGAEGMWYTFSNILRPAMPDLKVEILDQVAEGDKVTTRKRISGTHAGDLLGVPATGQTITIDVIDIVRLQGGKYLEHWGINNLAAILDQLRSQ